MARLFPTEENIHRLKVKPTDGEWFLLNYLVKHLDSDYEVYFQPFLNGDMPDIIVMRKDHGVIIFEVKDWNLDAYSVDENNKWHEKKRNKLLKSPQAQAFSYKNNMYSMHIEGLAQRNVMDSRFYSVIKPYVYFHQVTKKDVIALYSPATLTIDKNSKKLEKPNRQDRSSIDRYNRKMDYLKSKKRQLQRDKSMVLTKDCLMNIHNVLDHTNDLFDDTIYEEFQRYLKPPYHTLSQGIPINYGVKQKRLIQSKSEHKKIIGKAGSGKTTVLAKRAVNAHKRHGERVLILTYNKTLKNFIHDRISDVREGFSWDVFVISNYHSYMSQMFNQCKIDIRPPEGLTKEQLESHFESLYSDETIFEDYLEDVLAFDSIFIDELQDYKAPWIKIVRRYFLKNEGEMVLFGDDCQNIYERPSDKKGKVIVQGFGTAEVLTKSYRNKVDSPVLDLGKKFQLSYFEEKYNLDELRDANLEINEPSDDYVQPSFDIGLFKHQIYDAYDYKQLANFIVEKINEERIHPNDICIISSKIELLRLIEQELKKIKSEDIQTTFESEEVFQKLKQRFTKIYPGNERAIKYNLEKALKKFRDGKKYSFWLNSGLMKMSTIHSFKGFEAATVFYIGIDGDNDELVYTAITRAKINLVVFTPHGSVFENFFATNM